MAGLFVFILFFGWYGKTIAFQGLYILINTSHFTRDIDALRTMWRTLSTLNAVISLS